MSVKDFFAKLKTFFHQYLYYPKWRCLGCNKEIFTEEFFCEDCKKTLPRIEKNYCEKCGRQLKLSADTCTTCKGKAVYVDKSRSIYTYKKPINGLIMQLKYYNKQFIAEVFVEDLVNLYYKSYFNADYLAYVPMTEKSQKERGYNQSKLLAEQVSKIINVPVFNGMKKLRETKRQAKLNREQRLKNLQGSFSLSQRKEIKNKTVVIIDDVLTTGATGEVVAEIYKKYGAKQVFLLTIASVPNKDGY